MESLCPIVGMYSEAELVLHVIHVVALQHLMYVVGLGELECLRHQISLYPHA
mgnify:CR=1 FL=1